MRERTNDGVRVTRSGYRSGDFARQFARRADLLLGRYAPLSLPNDQPNKKCEATGERSGLKRVERTVRSIERRSICTIVFRRRIMQIVSVCRSG